MSITGRFVGVLVAIGAAVSAACGSGVDSGPPAPTATLLPYTPQFEEEFSESLLIADLTIEEVLALMGDPKTFEETFINRLPVLGVVPSSVFATLEPGDEFTEVLNVSLEGPGPFEWDYLALDEAPWLDVSRPQEEEEGDFDQLVLHFDSSGLSPGRYEASVTVLGLPVARESPQVIPVVFVVLEAQAP